MLAVEALGRSPVRSRTDTETDRFEPKMGLSAFRRYIWPLADSQLPSKRYLNSEIPSMSVAMTAFVLGVSRIQYLFERRKHSAEARMYLFERRKPSEKGAEGAISVSRG